MILWFSTTALLIKILGYLLPWWFVARQGNSEIDRYFIGIVFGLNCVNGIKERNCTEYSIGKAPMAIEGIVESTSMLVLQIAMSVNIGFLFISCMIIIGSSVTRMYNKSLMVMTIIFIGVSCVAYLVTLGFFIYIHITDIKKTSNLYEYNATNFPWSILIVSIGALFLFSSLVLLIIALCKWGDDDDVSIVSYDERKIVEYPAEPRYVYDNPKQYMVDRPMVHQPSNRGMMYAVEAPKPQYQQVAYTTDSMYRPYSAVRRY